MLFFKLFVRYWHEYPLFMDFYRDRKELIRKKVREGVWTQEDLKYLQKSRLRYAWDLARTHYRHIKGVSP